MILVHFKYQWFYHILKTKDPTRQGTLEGLSIKMWGNRLVVPAHCSSCVGPIGAKTVGWVLLIGVTQ